jgi:hypothetical protein
MPITLSADPAQRLTDFWGVIILTLGPSRKKKCSKEKDLDNRNLLCRAVTRLGQITGARDPRHICWA